MNYPDSQFYESAAIAKIIDKEGPFVRLISMWSGRCHVESRVKIKNKVLLDTRQDIHDVMRKICIENWVPPTVINKKRYDFLRDFKDELSPALNAFIGYACSQHSRFWWTFDDRAFAHRNTAEEAYRSLLRTRRFFDKSSDTYRFELGGFECIREADLQPVPTAMYIHVPEDPPYTWEELKDHMAWFLNYHDEYVIFLSVAEDPPLRFVKWWTLNTVYKSSNIYMLKGDITNKL